MAQKKMGATFRIDTTIEFMSDRLNNNSPTRRHPERSRRIPLRNLKTLRRDSSTEPVLSEVEGLGMTGPIRHLYVHIPFCARICPYCAFYKDLIDRAQTNRFCEAIL